MNVKNSLGLSPNVSAFYAEAASVCLTNQKHEIKTNMKVSGYLEGEICLVWETVSIKVLNNWRDLAEATEYGAVCIALLILQTLTDLR